MRAPHKRKEQNASTQESEQAKAKKETKRVEKQVETIENCFFFFFFRPQRVESTNLLLFYVARVLKEKAQERTGS